MSAVLIAANLIFGVAQADENSLFTKAGLDTAAYHLHQAINYLGVSSSGQCELGKDLANQHLNALEPIKDNADFNQLVKETSDFRDSTQEQYSQLEMIRFRFSQLLTKNKITHKLAWHKEVKSKCPNAPKVEF